MTATAKPFKGSYELRLYRAGVPKVDRTGLPKARREWTDGRRVALLYRVARGTPNRRGVSRWAFGTLTTEGCTPEQVAVQTSEGLKVVHYRRVIGLYDLSKGGPR